MRKLKDSEHQLELLGWVYREDAKLNAVPTTIAWFLIWSASLTKHDTSWLRSARMIKSFAAMSYR